MPLLRYIASLSFAGLLLAAGPLARAQNADSPEISRVMAQAEDHAALADRAIAEMDSYVRSKVSWKTHAEQLEIFRGHVNNLIGETNQLVALREQGSPWQQDAIDRVTPLLQEMADLLTSTINHLSENQSRVHMPPFIDYVDANQALANKILVTIRDYVEYDQAKARAASLEQKLGVASPADME